MVLLFCATAMFGAGLLFVVEPLVAKLLLPDYGGSANVWSTSTLFFQVLLIVGYLYVHVSTGRLGRRRQPWVHGVVLLLPLVALPLALPASAAPPDGGSPVVWLLRTLGLMVGLPFVMLCTTGPLLQKWYTWADGPRANDPYFLFAASNAGSFLGLLAYPFLIEPHLSLHHQRQLWSFGYVLFLILTGACAAYALRRRDATPTRSWATSPSPHTGHGSGTRRIATTQTLRWLGLAFLPSSLMLAVTAHISTDVAAVPLLWVVPLAIYLATFIVAFGRPAQRQSPRFLRLVVAVGFAAAVTAMITTPTPVVVSIGLNVVVLAIVAYAAHARLAAERPDPENLTYYFVIVSLGGALGGVLNGVIAPMVFDRVLEYPLVLLAIPLLAVGRFPRRERLWGRYHPSLLAPVGVLAVVVTALGCLYVTRSALPDPATFAAALAVTALTGYVLARHPSVVAAGLAVAFVLLAVSAGSDVIDRRRTFFGSYTIRSDGVMHEMIHGTTLHGTQFLDAADSGRPTTYYSRSGPLGDVMALDRGRFDSVAVVGLGAGTIAAYGRSGEHHDVLRDRPGHGGHGGGPVAVHVPA